MTRKKPDLGAIATTVQRLSVLLAAGVTPAAAWSYLDSTPLACAVARDAANGTPIPEAVMAATEVLPPAEQRIWRAVVAAWSVATDAGAPLAPTLDEVAASVRDLVQSDRDIAVALASPLATSRLVLVLPLIGLVFGSLLGFNTLATLVATPVGWVCLLVGGGLLLTAARWNRRMVRSARPAESPPGLELDLLSIAVAGGGALDRSRATVLAAMRRFEIAEPTELERGNTDEILELSRRAGVPAAALLRSEAGEQRRAARAINAELAQALSVRLMIPLGLCVLPAFMLLSVVPLVFSVLAATSFG